MVAVVAVVAMVVGVVAMAVGVVAMAVGVAMVVEEVAEEGGMGEVSWSLLSLTPSRDTISLPSHAPSCGSISFSSSPQEVAAFVVGVVGAVGTPPGPGPSRSIGGARCRSTTEQGCNLGMQRLFSISVSVFYIAAPECTLAHVHRTYI